MDAVARSTGQATVNQLMGSDAHRALILGEEIWATITHAACGRNGNIWTMAFARTPGGSRRP